MQVVALDMLAKHAIFVDKSGSREPENARKNL